MSEEIHIPISLPLDPEDYLRRQCPDCKREFKIKVEDGGIAEIKCCPYCGFEAGQNYWWTQEQVEFAKEMAFQKAAVPELKKLNKEMDKLNRGTKGFLDIEMDIPKPREPMMRPETNDMTVYTSPCCKVGVKVDDFWTGKLHCPSCRSQFEIPNE